MPTLTISQKVAIAVSVPLVAVVLYVFLKWSRDNEVEEDQEGEEFATSSDLVLEVKVPRQHVGPIIGRGGSNIKQIQKESQTRINFKDDEEESECSEEEGIQKGTRTLLVRGPREKAKHAEVLIRKVIAEQPTIEHSTMEIPQMVIGRVIGKGGNTIRQLCRISGAKIKIEEDGESISAYRICTITGTETQIESAKQLLHEKIGEDKMFRKKQRNLAKDQSTFVQLPTDGDYFAVYVSAMENPGHFWIQNVTKDSKKLDELVEEMTVFYGDKDGGHRLIPPHIGDLCCSPFQHDQSWYRGEIIDIIPGEEVQIQYLDFGDIGKVDLSNVKELRKEFCELPFQAIECYLSSIKPKDDKWSKDACNLFEKLSCCAQWKVLMARIVRYDNGVPCIELVDTSEKQDVNIEKELVKQGYAENNETTPDLKDVNIEKELVKQGYAENNETTPDLKDVNIEKELVKQGYAENNETTPDLKDVNIEKELVKQGYAENNETTPDLKDVNIEKELVKQGYAENNETTPDLKDVNIEKELVKQGYAENNETTPDLKDVNIEKELVKQGYAENNETTPDLKDVNIEKELVKQGYAENNETTPDLKDVNIEKELVKQGYAENNETTPDLKDVNIEKELVKQGYAENNETTPDLKDVNIEKELVKQGYAENNETTPDLKDVNIEKELVKQGYAENNETTPDLKDVNIEKELVKQGYAENNETTPDLKNPSTSYPDTQEPSTVEKPINFEETNEQFQSLNFDDEYSELDDNPTFEFASPATNTAGDELRNPTDVAPASKRTPASEPTLSAAELTVVSCVDMSNLSNVLDWDMYAEGIAGKAGKVDPASDARISPSAANLQGPSDEMTSNYPGILFPGDGSPEVQEHMRDDATSDVPISSSAADDLHGTSDEVTSSDNGILFPGDGTLGEPEYIEKDTPISSSAADDLQGVPDKGYHYSADVLFPGNNTLGVEEYIDGGSPSEDFSVAWYVSGVGNAENPSSYGAGEPIIETVLRDVLCSTPVEADVTRVTAAPDSLSKLASNVVETGNGERRRDRQPNSSAYSLRRSLSDDFPSDETLTNGGDRELTRSSSETVVSPRRGDEIDRKEKLSSKSLSSLEHLSKGNKRMMAANFAHKYASEKDGVEDDDDSLYLSAREDSDSTGFTSATGSSINLRDTDSDVTPSGYLSDPDEAGDGEFLVNETEDQTRLDRTLLAEKLEQYADK